MGQFVRNVRELGEIVSALQSQGKKVVYTAGIWDIVHVGQIRALRDAKSRGDYLVVGVHTDDACEGRLGSSRPFLSEKDRVDFITGLESVDYVILAGSEDDASVLEDLQASILATGVDTSLTVNVDKKCVTQAGGKVCAIAGRRGLSVVQLLQRYQSGDATDEVAAPSTKMASARKAAPKKAAKKATSKKAVAKKATTKKTAKKAGAGGSKKKTTRKVAARKTAAKQPATKKKAKAKTATSRAVAKKSAAARGKVKKTTTKSQSRKRKPQLVGAS